MEAGAGAAGRRSLSHEHHGLCSPAAARLQRWRFGAVALGPERARRPRATRAEPPVALRQHLRRDGRLAPPSECLREQASPARPGRARYRARAGRRHHDTSRWLRRLNMPERVILCIGTRKGLLVAEAPKTRGSFALRGPFGPGVGVYSTLIDTRGKPRLYASSCNAFFGMKVMLSTDLGKTFKETKSAPAFPKDDGRALINIWSLEAGDNKMDLWCGVEPSSLFRSDDGGDSWEMVPGISNHPHARKWQPGAGGLCLHTILRDGKRVHLGISTGGHYLSEDGGKTFKPSNKGVGAGFAPDPYPEFGQCVHKIARHKDAPGRLYMQTHGGWAEWDVPGGPRPDIGVLRSDDYGQSWRSIAKGLPSDFGFPIVVHPHDADTVYVMPLEPSTRTCQ